MSSEIGTWIHKSMRDNCFHFRSHYLVPPEAMSVELAWELWFRWAVCTFYFVLQIFCLLFSLWVSLCHCHGEELDEGRKKEAGCAGNCAVAVLQRILPNGHGVISVFPPPLPRLSFYCCLWIDWNLKKKNLNCSFLNHLTLQSSCKYCYKEFPPEQTGLLLSSRMGSVSLAGLSSSFGPKVDFFL